MDSLFMHKPTPALCEANLTRRGLLSVVRDGRFKFGRYYAPTACNTPQTLDDLLGNNDVQLFDLQNDPGETRNLALDSAGNQATILRMNGLLNDLIEKEIGSDASQRLERLLEAIGK